VCICNITARPYGLPARFKYYPSTCSKTCAGPLFWYLPDDEPQTLNPKTQDALNLMFDDTESSMLQSGQTTGSVRNIRYTCSYCSEANIVKHIRNITSTALFPRSGSSQELALQKKFDATLLGSAFLVWRLRELVFFHWLRDWGERRIHYAYIYISIYLYILNIYIYIYIYKYIMCIYIYIYI